MKIKLEKLGSNDGVKINSRDEYYKFVGVLHDYGYKWNSGQSYVDDGTRFFDGYSKGQVLIPERGVHNPVPKGYKFDKLFNVDDIYEYSIKYPELKTKDMVSVHNNISTISIKIRNIGEYEKLATVFNKHGITWNGGQSFIKGKMHYFRPANLVNLHIKLLNYKCTFNNVQDSSQGAPVYNVENLKEFQDMFKPKHNNESSKFNLDDIPRDTGILINNKQDYDKIAKILHEHGYRWNLNETYVKSENWYDGWCNGDGIVILFFKKGTRWVGMPHESTKYVRVTDLKEWEENVLTVNEEIISRSEIAKKNTITPFIKIKRIPSNVTGFIWDRQKTKTTW